MEIGNKIRQLRLRHNLTLEELADRTELSKGFLSQLERDLTSPSIATLVDILECLGTNLQDFFTTPKAPKVVFGVDDTFEKENHASGCLIRWLIPDAQKNEMEPILITLAPGGESTPDDPHAGEEFGYVLSGTVYLHEGNHAHKVKKGESFYFRAVNPHWLSNKAKTPAIVLWVSDPPSF